MLIEALPVESAVAVPSREGLLISRDFPLHAPLVIEVFPEAVE
jgi:hypothetical protein